MYADITAAGWLMVHILACIDVFVHADVYLGSTPFEWQCFPFEYQHVKQ